jgi:hypothetical protein
MANKDVDQAIEAVVASGVTVVDRLRPVLVLKGMRSVSNSFRAAYVTACEQHLLCLIRLDRR